MTDSDVAHAISSAVTTLEARLLRLEDDLGTIQLLLVAQYLRDKGDSQAAEDQYQKASARARKQR